LSQARDDTYMLDIGANIGLMAIPVLQLKPRVRVLSFEPSPNTLPVLERTISSNPNRERWTLIRKAVGSTSGLADFHLAAPENSLFDGLRNTQRVAQVKQVQVEMTTVDAEWDALGKPPVSVIKCDIEGGELAMLTGALECLRQARPSILLEWNFDNLRSFHISPESLLVFANNARYTVHAVPSLAEIHESAGLSAHMAFTESFLLLPRNNGVSRFQPIAEEP